MRRRIVVMALLLSMALLLFALSFTATIMWRGGISPDSPLARVPVLGPAVAAREGKPAEEEIPDPTLSVLPPVYGPGLFLQLGPEGRVEWLGRELEKNRLEQEKKLAEIRSLRRELDSWSDQIEEEREALRLEVEKKREQLARKAYELDRQEHRIQSAERVNLEKTAQIYERMDPERAGSILAEIYREGDRDTVVKIISLMRDRNAAQALAGMPGEQISAEITERLKYVTHEED